MTQGDEKWGIVSILRLIMDLFISKLDVRCTRVTGPMLDVHLLKYKPATDNWKLETSCKSCQISFCCGAEFVELHPRVGVIHKNSEEPIKTSPLKKMLDFKQQEKRKHRRLSKMRGDLRGPGAPPGLSEIRHKAEGKILLSI